LKVGIAYLSEGVMKHYSEEYHVNKELHSRGHM